MPDQKKENKELKWYEKHWTKLLYIILPAVGMFLWEQAKDIFATGTEVKVTNQIVNIITTDPTVEAYFRGIVKDEIASTMNDAATWLKVLDNDLLKGYTDEKVEVVFEELDRKIAQIDSAQHNLINEIGKTSGIRNDEFVKIFSLMIRDYKKEHLDMVSVDAF